MRWYDLGAVTVGGWKLTKRPLGIVCLLNCGFSQCWYVVSVCVQIEEMELDESWRSKLQCQVCFAFQYNVFWEFRRLLKSEILPRSYLGLLNSSTKSIRFTWPLSPGIFDVRLFRARNYLRFSNIYKEGNLCYVGTKLELLERIRKLFTTEKCALARYSLFYKLTKKL